MDPQNPNPNLSALVNPQSYAMRKRMIEEARMRINQFEAQNEAGFQAFAYTEQELQRRIREGREAEMLSAQIGAGSFSQRQPQPTTWQTFSTPPPSVQQNFLPTSARIEEVPSVAPVRISRSGPTLQPHGQFVSYGNVPAETTTYISQDFHSWQPPRRQSYYTSPTIHTPAVPVQQPPSPPAHQPPPQQEPLHPVTPTSPHGPSHPVPAHVVPLPRSSTEQTQPTTQSDYVKQLLDFLRKHSPEVQRRILAQINEYIGGKPTPSPQIRAWGDRLKQVGSPDPRKLLDVVVNKVQAQWATKSQTSQQQPQAQAEPPAQPRPMLRSLPASQSQTAHEDQLPRPKSPGATERPADGPSPLPPAEEQTVTKVFETYGRELSSAKIDSKRLGDIISVAYISALSRQPPNSSDIWVRKTLDVFEAHFPIDRIPLILKFLLERLRRPIPNIPVSTGPWATGRSSSSLAGALVDTAPSVAPSTMTQHPSAATQPLANGAVVETGAPDSLPEAQIPQSRDPEPTTIPQIQAIGNTPHIPTQPSPSSGIMPTSPTHPTQLALVPRRNFPDAISNLTQGGGRPSQAPGLVQYRQPETSAYAPPKQPPVRVRLPREADLSRLAKDILKQLGRPNGSVPAVLTKREYKERTRAEAGTKGTSVHPSPEPIAETQLVLNLDEVPPPQDPVPGQAALSTLPTNQLQENLPHKTLLPGYPAQHRISAPPDANGIERDVEMDIQISGDSLVSRSSGSPLSDLPQDSASPLMDPESTQGKEGGSAAKNPPSKPQSSRWTGPSPDTEVIEISDDEGQPVVGAVVATVEPMEVDGEVGIGGAISKNLSHLSPDGGDTPVVVEIEGRTKEPLDHRSPQEPVVFKDIQFTEKKSQKIQPYVQVPPLPDFVRQNKAKERALVEAEDEEDPELQAVVDLAFSRLRPTRCLWLGCRATLNSVNNLIKHLKIHADEAERTSDNLECQWKKCSRSYRTRVKLDRHCMHHAQKILHCPYEDCGEEFRDAGELLDHTKDMHESSDLLPSTNPVPYSGRVLDPLPEQVPSWTVLPVLVAPVPISADRHSQIGRWVARNICGTAKKAYSSRRLPSSRRFDARKQKSTGSGMEEMMNEERFGFISSTDDGNTMFADIPSEAVSLSCRYGQLIISENDGHPRGNERKRSVIEESDVEDVLVRADAPVEEAAIALELGPVPSDDELLLKQADQ